MVEERESVRQRDGRERVEERPRWRDGERSREVGRDGANGSSSLTTVANP